MELINCFVGFEQGYDKRFSIKELQEYWYSFMGRYENVRNLCINDYKEQGYDWIDVASKKVFSYDELYVIEMSKTIQRSI